MSEDLAVLLLRMAVAASFVVGCSQLAEKAGPLVAALIATLPISAGPVYVFLALSHDADFIAAAGPGSMASNMGNAGLLLTYTLLAQRHGLATSVGFGLLVWIAIVVTVRMLAPPLAGLLALTILIFGTVTLLLRPYRSAEPPAQPRRVWYAMPLRADGVALLTGLVTAVSARVGGAVSGVIAAFPIVFTSLIVILHPRLGGKATGAILANSPLALMGFGVALGSLALSAPRYGSWVALAGGLAICVLWNLALLAVDRLRR